MKALRFDIYGKFAHFKNPENNSYIEVTYEHITKPHLLGILGAIIGLNGRQQHRKIGYIEYWEKLKGCKISIVPHQARWKKHIDITTNTTGYANRDGDNQLLRRQYLNNPRWTIYVAQGDVKDEIWDRLIQNIIKGESVYPIFLGQTGNYANIENVKLIHLDRIELQDVEYCNSLFVYNNEKVMHEINGIFSKMMLPIGLDEKGLYIKRWICLTDCYVEFENNNFYKFKDNILSFL